MNKSFRKALTLTFGALLCLGLTAGPAFAYFTDTVNASGSAALKLGNQSEINENLDGLNKNIAVKNTGETDALVRVKVFYAEDMKDVTVTVTGGNGWTESDGWYYYQPTLKPGESAANFRVDVTAKGEATELLNNFDITVIEQSSQVFGNENGNRIGVFGSDKINWDK